MRGYSHHHVPNVLHERIQRRFGQALYVAVRGIVERVLLGGRRADAVRLNALGAELSLVREQVLELLQDTPDEEQVNGLGAPHSAPADAGDRGLLSEAIARFGSIVQRVERGGWRAVALLRLIPVVPHGVANYGLGLTGLGLGAYACGSLLGQLPMTIAYVGLGAAGERLLLGSSGWIEPTLIGLAALSLSLLIPAYSRWRPR